MYMCFTNEWKKVTLFISSLSREREKKPSVDRFRNVTEEKVSVTKCQVQQVQKKIEIYRHRSTMERYFKSIIKLNLFRKTIFIFSRSS